MQTQKPALVFRTSDPHKTCLFYGALGLFLTEETHEGCPPHYSCDLGALVIEFYPLRKGMERVDVDEAQTWFFETDSFDVILGIIRKLDLHRESTKTYDDKTGFRIVTLYDPDDRPVRLKEIGLQPAH